MSNHSFSFSSKADTLQSLSSHTDLHIPAVYAVEMNNWRTDTDALQAIQEHFAPTASLAVRSSCRRENSTSTSAAGAFLSILNVDAADASTLRDAVEKVIASYGEAAPDDQVLVQPMIQNVAVTGVILTRGLNDGSPYYVHQLR